MFAIFLFLSFCAINCTETTKTYKEITYGCSLPPSEFDCDASKALCQAMLNKNAKTFHIYNIEFKYKHIIPINNDSPETNAIEVNNTANTPTNNIITQKISEISYNRENDECIIKFEGLPEENNTNEQIEKGCNFGEIFEKDRNKKAILENILKLLPNAIYMKQSNVYENISCTIKVHRLSDKFITRSGDNWFYRFLTCSCDPCLKEENYTFAPDENQVMFCKNKENNNCLNILGKKFGDTALTIAIAALTTTATVPIQKKMQ